MPPGPPGSTDTLPTTTKVVDKDMPEAERKIFKTKTQLKVIMKLL